MKTAFIYIVIFFQITANDVSTNNDEQTNNLSRYSMWMEPRDVWCIKFDPIWIDFLGARSLGQNKPIPFIDAVPITLWIHESVEFEDDSKNVKLTQKEI